MIAKTKKRMEAERERERKQKKTQENWNVDTRNTNTKKSNGNVENTENDATRGKMMKGTSKQVNARKKKKINLSQSSQCHR